MREKVSGGQFPPDFSGNSPFAEGNVESFEYVDESGQVNLNISDHYMQQLSPGVYKVNIYAISRTYSDTDSEDIWIGQASGDPHGIERYFEYTTDEDIYGSKGVEI